MIEYKSVCKNYGEVRAVSGFSLHIQKGEFFGLLGPNGAGKTTLLRMTSTITAAGSGEILIGGRAIHRNLTGTKRKIGIVPQYSNLEAELSAWENLEYHGRLYGLPRARRRRRMDELLAFSGLTDRKHDKAKKFSGGMQRRLMIAKSLMHEPEILLLDEPTAGLDAGSRRNIWDLLRYLNKTGITVLLTTHYLEEAQILCSRVGMIDRGRLKQTGRPEDLIKAAGNYVVEYFENGKTVQRFFDTEEAAIDSIRREQTAEVSERAESVPFKHEVRVRAVNLEDAFILLADKMLDNETNT
jgi:ABC-2 type transport system ATP-binding protein